MSFAKSQRFGVKESDMFGSPADYDISIRLGKDCHFGENPKFQGTVTKNGTMSFVLYSHSNRSSRSQPTCSTPKANINKKRMSKRKKKYHSSFKQVSTGKVISNQPSQKWQENDENENNRKLFEEYENLPGTSGSVNKRGSNLTSVNRRESIDDDYELTLSEKSEVISGNRVCLSERLNNYGKINQSKRDSTFRKMVLQKISKIEKHVEQLRKALAYLSGKIQTGQIQEQHDKKNVKRYLYAENNTMFRRKYDDIVKIIADAIKHLSDEFENRRRASLRLIEENIHQVLEKMYSRSNKDTKHIKKMCEATSANLIKEVMSILNTADVGELECELSDHESTEHELSEHFSIMIRDIEKWCDDTGDGTDTYFNYENTCKILSDKLLSSKNELDVLEQEKQDITIKFSDIQKTLEEQGSLMDILQAEINHLRQDVTKNV